MTFKKGDLVMVVKPRGCCSSTSLGKIFTVGGVIIADTYCHICGSKKESTLVVQTESLDWGFESSRLIKIDPPADQDQETTDKELEVVV